MLITKHLLLISFFIIPLVHSQDLSPEQIVQLDQIIAPLKNVSSPGGAIGVVLNGKVVYEEYIGYSNMEHGIAINENTRFNIASNAKQYTALCVLKLIDEGAIKLEDDIRDFVPEIYKNVHETISISSLLTHSSGIRDVYDLWSLQGKTWWKLFVDNSDAMELIASQNDLNFKPGTQYLYSNSNYILLTEVIKKATGKEFKTFAQEMFANLDMKSTSFATNSMGIIPNKARPYGNWGRWLEYPSVAEIHGDGALFTTLNDQLNWEKLIQAKKESSLSKKIINTSQKTIHYSTVKNYGYGLMHGTYKGFPYLYHDGNTGAYNATFLRFPEKTLSVVVMSNNGNVSTNQIAKQFANILLEIEENKSEYPSGPKKIDPLFNTKDVVGNYKTEDGTIIKIVEKDGVLYREIYQRDAVKLINEKGGLFHYETNKELKIYFSKDNNGAQIFTIYLPTQEPQIGVQQLAFHLNSAYVTSLNGLFYNHETKTEIAIKYLDNTTYSITKNGRERKGELVLKDFLRMNSYEIKITRNVSGMVNGLKINNGRIKNVVFVKR